MKKLQRQRKQRHPVEKLETGAKTEKEPEQEKKAAPSGNGPANLFGISNEILRNITLIGQLGLSFIMPTLICVLLCAFLTVKAGVGEWVYIPGFILGIGSSFMTAYKFYKADISKEKEEKKRVSFNKHE